MSFQLAEADLENLKAALVLLNKVRSDCAVNVCAYGSIDVEVGDGGYLRLEHIEGVGYVFMEQFR